MNKAIQLLKQEIKNIDGSINTKLNVINEVNETKRILSNELDKLNADRCKLTDAILKLETV